MFVPKEEWMKKNLTKLVVMVTAILSIFTLFTSCPPDPVGPNEDPSAIAEPQYPVYLLLLEDEDGTPTKGLYYNSTNGKWYKNYENGNTVVGSELSETEELKIPPRTAKVSIDIPYKSGTKGFEYPTLEEETPLKGYYLNSSDSTPVVNEKRILNPSYFSKGITKRTVVKAEFNSATIDLSDLNRSVNEYIKSLGKNEEVKYWTTEGDPEEYVDNYKTVKKNSKITLTTTSQSSRLDFNLNDATNEGATSRVYYNEGKWYLDLTFENSISTIVPPKKEWKVSFNVNPNGIEPLLNQKNPDSQISRFEFNGYKDNEGATVVDKDGKINENYSLGENDTRTLSPNFALMGTGINLNTLTPSYQKGFTVKGYVFKGWSKNQDGSLIIAEESESSYVPESKTETLYAVWEPIVYELNLASDTDGGVIFSGDSKIYYWEDHGWYKSKENLSEASERIEKIEIPIKEWTVNIDDKYDGRVIDNVIQNSATTYSSLQKDEVKNEYVYRIQWIFNGYSVSNQKVIDKDGNIIGTRIVKDEVVDSDPQPWVEQGGANSRLLLPIKSDMNTMASTEMKITRTFTKWIVNNGKKTIDLTDRERLAPNNDYIYDGPDKSDRPEIRIEATWEKGNEGTLRLIPGDSTEFNLPNEIYSEYNPEKQQGFWYSDIERTERIVSLESIPKKVWKVTFKDGDETKGSSDYEFTFRGFIDDAITYIDENGDIKASALKTSTPKEVYPKFDPSSANGVELLKLDNKQGYELLGWSRDRSAKVPDENLNVSRLYFVPNENNITLYAIWSPIVNRIELNANATNKSNMTKVIYSRFDENGQIKYYFDRECTKEYNDNTSEELIKPERKYTISFANTKGIEVAAIPVSYKFNGYSVGLGLDFIDADGKIVYTTNESKAFNLEASLSELENEITLPVPDLNNKIVGYKFLYWSRTSDGVEFDKKYTSDITLYGVWQPEVFTLNLSAGEYATDKENATKVLYYLYDNGWYKEKTEDGKVVLSSKVSSSNPVVLPKKTLTIRFDKKTDEEVVAIPEDLLSKEFKLEFQFGSYSDENRVAYITKKGNSVELIDKIEKDINATVVWSNFPHLDINNYSLRINNDDPNKNSFNGWGIDPNNNEEVISGNQYTPDDTVSGEVVLYAKWKGRDLLTLTLDDNGATTEGQHSIYYHPGVDEKTGVWYSDAEGTIPLENNTLTELPKKEWKVTLEYGENEDEKTESVSSFTFEGYVNTAGGSDNIQISSDGKISDNSYITKNTTLVARWSDTPSGVRLLTPPDKKGYTFKGWSLTKDGDVIGKDEYIPENDNVKLYAIYESEVYSLYLSNVINVDDDSASLYKTLYYKYNVGWYNDKQCTDPVTNIALPQSTFVVNFSVGGHNVATPQQKVVNRKFAGYYFKNANGGYDDDDVTKTVVDENGLLVISKITEDSRVFSKWNAQSVSLPQGLNDPGWTFGGWIDGGGNLYRNSFNPIATTNLTALWQPITYTITLVHSNATDETNVPKRIRYTTGSGWFDEDGNQIERINTPKREYTVNLYTGNEDPVSKKPLTSSIPFNGYYYNGDTRPYIKEDGEINKDINDIYEDKIINVRWDSSASQKLNIPARLTYNTLGHTFKGWSEVDKSSVIIDVNNYQPQSKETTLYAIFEPDHYTLTLEVQNEDKSHLTNESSYTKKVYFDYDNGWYEDENYTTKLSKVKILPERIITVTVDKNDQTVTSSQQTQVLLTSKFPFLGFADKNGSDIFVSPNGDMVSAQEKKLLNDTTVYAMFDLQDNVYLPTDNADNKVDGQEVFTASGGGWSFEGFNEDKNKTEIEYYPGSTYRPQKDVTLYAIWKQNNNRLTLTKDPSDGRPEYSHDIYFRTNSTGYEWYSDSSCTNKLPSISVGDFPSRRYTVSFDVNAEGVETPEDRYYDFTFDGFSVPFNNTFVKIIDANGTLKTSYSDIPRGALDNGTEAIADWVEPDDPLTLPNLTKSDKTDFMGWNISGVPGDDVITGTIRPTEDMALKAVWGYLQKTLTLNSPSATEHGDAHVYYVTSSTGSKTSGWYKNPTDSEPIVSISTPKKEYTVILDYNYERDNKEVELPYSYDFLGYYDDNNEPWVSDSGALFDNKVLSGNLTVNAWFKDEQHGNIDPKDPIYLERDYPLSRDGYEPIGWSKSKDEYVPVGAEYRPDNNTTLYAFWDGNVYSANLNGNGADNDDALVKTLYYKMGDGWYRDRECENNSITYLENSEIPKKEYKVTFISGGDINPEPETSTFGFEGYYLDNRMVVRPSGVIVSTLENGEEGATLEARWSEPSPISLQFNIKREGYEFVGWSTKENASPSEARVTSTYTPNGNETLYGVWKPNVYKLTLSAPDKRNSQSNDAPTETLYYKVDDGWYYDEEATIAFSSSTLKLPTKEWDVVLLGSGFGGFTRDEKVSSFAFDGYKDSSGSTIISSDGTFAIENYTIEKDIELTARWGGQTSIELPQLTQTGYTFYGWSEQNTGRDNVIRTDNYFPRREETYLYAISNSDVFMLNLTANDGNGTVESTVTAIYYKASSSDAKGGWYLDANGSGEAITKITIPTSYCTVSYDDIHIKGLPEPIESKIVYRHFDGFKVNGETYIDEEGNIVKESITSSYNATAAWGDYDEIESLYDGNTDEILKLPYLVFKEWREKESGNVITSPYRPNHNITIVPTYRRSYIDVVFETTTNNNYNDYNFDVEFEYDRLWIDVQDGKWYLPYGVGQTEPQKGSPIESNRATFKPSSYSIRIADPYSSDWTADTTNNNWKGSSSNLTKDLTTFYESYDTDARNVEIEMPNILGVGFAVSQSTLRLFADENFNLLNYSEIKNNNPSVDFETGSALYRVCVLYSSEGEHRTTSVSFPINVDNETIRNFEYANRPSCVVFNTRSPRNRTERRQYENNYNAFCNAHRDEDLYFFIGTGLRIIEVEVTHANVPNVIYDITRDNSTLNFNKEDGNTIVFDHTDNDSELTHYLLPYRYNFGDYLAADTTLDDMTTTSYSIQRVNTRPQSGTYVSTTNGTNVNVTLLNGETMALKDVTILPYVSRNN